MNRGGLESGSSQILYFSLCFRVSERCQDVESLIPPDVMGDPGEEALRGSSTFLALGQSGSGWGERVLVWTTLVSCS